MLGFCKNLPYLAIELHPNLARLLLVTKSRRDLNIIKFQEISELSWQANPELFSAALKTFLHNNKCRICFVSLSNHYFEFHPQSKLAMLETAEQLETIHLELERLYGQQTDYYFDFNHDVLVTLAPHIINPLLSTLQRLNILVSLVTANCFVLANLSGEPLDWQNDKVDHADSIVRQLVQDGLQYAIN